MHCMTGRLARIKITEPFQGKGTRKVRTLSKFNHGGGGVVNYMKA